MTVKNIVIEGSRIQIKDVISVAIHEEQISLSSSEDFIKRIDDGAKLVRDKLNDE